MIGIKFKKLTRDVVVVSSMAFTLLNPYSAIGNEWNISSLMSSLSDVTYAKLDFKETKRSIFIITDLIIEGTIEYKAPDYIEKNSFTPKIEKVIIEGDSMTIESTGKAGKVDAPVRTQNYSVKSHPILKAAVESIRAMLAGDLDLLQENYKIEFEGVQSDWKLNLIPKADDIREFIQQMNLSGNDTEIAEIVTIQADGDKISTELMYQLLESKNL